MRRLVCAVLFALGIAGGTLPEAPGQAGPRVLPTNLAGVNTPKDEDDPHVAFRGLALYYTSNARGHYQVLVARRSSANGAWGAGKPLDALDAETDNRSPCLSADDHDLFFATRIVVRDPDKKTAETLGYDIVHAVKLLKADQFTGPTPVQSVCTEADELFPWLTADGGALYFSRKTREGWRLFVAGRPKGKGAFGEPTLIQELPTGFHHATLTRDGRTMFLQGPLDKQRWGLFRSTRASHQAAWSEPVLLDELNSPEAPVGDASPSLSRDDAKLYFSSDRPGGKGGRDLWVVDTRRLRGK